MDLYTTNQLIGVVESLKTPSSFLLDRYFTRQSTDESEEIHFDIIEKKRRLAPFVSPLVAGKVVESAGRRVATFKPAYVKDKRVFDPSQPLKRAIGETIGGGQLTAAQRRDAHLANELQDQLEMLTRRLEVMAAEALRTGKVTVTGDEYDTVVVDFLRDATLSPAVLAGTELWSDAACKPLRKLRALAKIVRKLSGVNPKDVIMGEDAFSEFIDNATVEKKLDTRNVGNYQLAPSIGNGMVEGGTFQGSIEGFDIFTYSGWYVDPADGVEKEIFPAKEIVMTSALVEGVRAFGAIRDGKAGYKALPYFPKMWESEDPASELLMLQSAPLVVPTRVNASLKQQVLA